MLASAALRALHESGPDAEQRWRAEAADLTEADVLLVLRIGEGHLALAAFDGRGVALADTLTRESDDGDAARSFLDDVLPPPTVPWYGQWWFWTPLALAISIGLATLTYVVVNVPDVQILGGSVVRE